MKNENYPKLIDTLAESIDEIKQLSFDALKDDLDKEKALYTINQESHRVKHIIETYFIQHDDGNRSNK